HPRFPEQPYLYAMETIELDSLRQNRVVRFRLSAEGATFDRVILEGIPGGINHDGGRLAFGPDGYLYVTAGEAFQAPIAQDLKSLGGKVLRVADDGSLPSDNPFPGSPVFTYGHRNPQGLAWDPLSGLLVESEHGPSGEYGLHAFDEINVLEPGRNYGWP